MSQQKQLIRSFAGGEITPELFGRVDLGKNQTGLAKCLNFIVLPHGPITRRPGTTYVREVKDSSAVGWLLPFAFSASQTMALEFGNLYVRFHTMGAVLAVGTPAAYSGATAYTPGDLVASGGTNYLCIANTTGNAPPNATYWYAQPATGEYEVPTPYTTAHLPDLHFKQSSDVFTIMHPSYPTRELRRAGALKWYTSAVSFAPALAAPTGLAAANTVGTGTVTYSYVVTAVAENGVDESLAQTPATCTNNLLTAGNYNTITWTASTGASRYNVYKLTGGVHSYIGQASGLTFKDDNFLGDQTKTPPESLFTLNTGTGEYPSTGAYHDQRRCFAGTDNDPQGLVLSRSATETNLTASIPSQGDDAITARIAAQQQNRIRHLVPLTDLIALTAGGEWRIYGGNTETITPSSITIKPQGYSGANNVQPVVTSGSVLYAQARGSRIRELAYNETSQGSTYKSVDLSIMAPHLFNGYTITQLAYASGPDQIAWAIRSDGVLLGLTYVPEHQVYAWHQHTTDGLFESICVVAEGNEDVLYTIVKRTVGGVTQRYVERLSSRMFALLEDAFFVDCGLTYEGAAAASLTGLDHLEGEEVAILANGSVHPRRTVTAGAVTLDASYTKVHVGLPIIADAQTLPLVLDGAQAAGQGTYKNVNEVRLRVYQSSGVQAGPAFNKLREYPSRAVSDPYGSPPALRTGELTLSPDPEWGTDGTVCVRKDDPLPLTLLSLVAVVTTGG